jgi:AcrR family transcriptional regulator
MEIMSEETPKNLLAAAESLLAEKGHAAVTLRDITEQAKANVAAVAYHFGSKDELVAHVFKTALIEVTEAQTVVLENLPSGSTLRDVVRAWLAPAIDPEGTTPRIRQLWGLIQRGSIERAPGLLASVATMDVNVVNPLFSWLVRLIPEVPPKVLRLRHDLVLGGIASIMTGQPSLEASGPPNAASHGDALIDWVVGGLTSPVTR